MAMLEIRQTEEFELWLKALRDRVARAKILIRIERLALGNPGDAKPVGGRISEMRIDHGPGYRVYCTRRGSALVILLCAGDESTQRRDIARAKAIAAELED
jgi:putative addiction module killer protein